MSTASSPEAAAAEDLATAAFALDGRERRRLAAGASEASGAELADAANDKAAAADAEADEVDTETLEDDEDDEEDTLPVLAGAAAGRREMRKHCRAASCSSVTLSA